MCFKYKAVRTSATIPTMRPIPRNCFAKGNTTGNSHRQKTKNLSRGKINIFLIPPVCGPSARRRYSAAWRGSAVSKRRRAASSTSSPPAFRKYSRGVFCFLKSRKNKEMPSFPCNASSTTEQRQPIASKYDEACKSVFIQNCRR